MKYRIISVLSILLAVSMLAGCAASGGPETTASSEATEEQTTTAVNTEAETESTSEEVQQAEAPESMSEPVHIGALKGPTGIGMAYLFGLSEQGYDVTLYDSPDQVNEKLISGELDAAALPSNAGAVLYNKTGGKVICLAVNTGSTLFIVGDGIDEVASLSDLKGKTVYASGQGAVPEYVLKALMKENGLAEDDIEINWMASHTDVVSTVLKEGGYALLPEPHVTVAMSKSDDLRIAVDLGKLWEETYASVLPMGILAVGSSFVEERPEDCRRLVGACEASVEKVLGDIPAASEQVAGLEIVPSAQIAASVIPRCGIMFEHEPETVNKMLYEFYNILYNFNPAAVGGTMPETDYYGVHFQ